jgi:PAS domain S-box-containing protein
MANGPITKGPKARVLIVEDEAIVAKDIAATLKGMHYQVAAIAATGEGAVRDAGRRRPDIVLMDILLPGALDGVAAGQRIQSEFGIPVVFLTAHADEATLSRAKAIAPYGYLIKPFADRELEVVLETARYRAAMERQLNEQRHWVAAMLDCIGDAVIAADVGSTVILMNPVAEHLTGWKREKAVGRPLSEVFHTIEEASRRRVESSEARALHDDTAIDEDADDVVLVSANGVERPIDMTISPINDAKGNLLGIVTVFRDVTSRRLMEKRAINRQKMEALGKLSSNIAHDFNNIIGLIAGYTTAMQEYLLPNSRAYEDMKRILAAVEHAGALGKRILGVARASDTERNLNVRPVALGEAVQSAVSLLRDAFEKRGIRIRANLPPSSPFVHADRSHLVDLLVDILLNSAEAMPDGGKIAIDLRAYTLLKPDPKLNPRAKPGPYATLRIKDSGVGMSRETLDRIFEPFFTTKSTGTHVGLGLSILHSAVQFYGGWIKAASEPGQGAVFSIFLPKAAPAGARPPPAHETTTGSILVTDDDDATRQELRDILARAGYTVHVASNGDDALAQFRKLNGKLDLTIVDVIMPGKDGKFLLQEIVKVDPTAAVLMLCGFSREYVRAYLPSGPWRFMQKPVDPDALLSAVRRTLEQKQP